MRLLIVIWATLFCMTSFAVEPELARTDYSIYLDAGNSEIAESVKSLIIAKLIEDLNQACTDKDLIFEIDSAGTFSEGDRVEGHRKVSFDVFGRCVEEGTPARDPR